MTRDREPESTFSLLERARAGDRQAIELLVARHRTPLQRWASGRLPRWARGMVETQDLVQETLFQTFRKIETFRPERVGALQAYLRQAVLNRIRDELRRAGRRPAPDAVPGRSGPTTTTSTRGHRRSKKRLASRRPNVTKQRSPRCGRKSAKRSSA